MGWVAEGWRGWPSLDFFFLHDLPFLSSSQDAEVTIKTILERNRTSEIQFLGCKLLFSATAAKARTSGLSAVRMYNVAVRLKTYRSEIFIQSIKYE